jgi:nitroreductase
VAAVKRRALLKGAGVVAVVAAGGVVWRAYEQGVFSPGAGPAFEPWTTWRSDAAEGPLRLVRAAILAASPHNTQPWLFRVSPTRIEAYADTARNLGAFDPYLREMHIGLGCAVENMARAAGAFGYEVAVTLAPGALSPPGSAPRCDLVATLELKPTPALPDPLFDAIARRHTDRAAYDAARAVPADVLGALHAAVPDEPELKLFLFPAPAERGALGKAMVAATETIIADASMVADSERWFRHRRADAQRLRDGLVLDSAGLSPLMLAAAKIMPPPSPETSHRYWLDATRDVHVATAPLLGLIAVRDLYDRPQALRAGRAWQRLHLFATTRGLVAQPINQPVEVVDRERELGRPPRAAGVLAELTGDPAWKPTFAFRMGFPTHPAPPSPRRRVEDVVITG